MNFPLSLLLIAFVLTCAWTPCIIVLAKKWRLLDEPDAQRKKHLVPTPLGGGLALFVPLLLLVSAVLLFSDLLTSGDIGVFEYGGVLAGAAVLVVGGLLDDRFRLPPRYSVWFPVLAVLIAIGGGLEISKLSHPFGGVLFLSAQTSAILVFVWLLTTTYTTKLLDGSDGLAVGVTLVGVFLVAALSASPAFSQPDVLAFSLTCLGVLLGFFVWNRPRARIFLGEGGSTLVGYLLGVLAVISGAKLAVAAVALVIPFLNILWVIQERWRMGGWKAISEADRRHLHHRLQDAGWSAKAILYLYIFVATFFGVLVLGLQTQGKLLALGALVMLALFVLAVMAFRARGPRV